MTTNHDRASHFAALLLHFDDCDKTALIDLLANALHWCHENREDFGEALRIARMHFEAETSEVE